MGVWGSGALGGVATGMKVVLLAATHGTLDPAALGLDKALLNDPVGALTADPMRAAGKMAGAVGQVLPGVLHVAAWLAPVLLVVWVVVSTWGGRWCCGGRMRGCGRCRWDDDGSAGDADGGAGWGVCGVVLG